MTTGTALPARAEAYLALAEGFKEPTPAFAADVASGVFADVLAGTFAAMGLGLEEADLRAGGEAERVLADLRDAYHALFSVPSPRFVLPVESTFKEWCAGEGLPAGLGLIFGPPALDMAERYRQRGLEVPPDMKDTPDHLALILEYGGLLCAESSSGEQPGFVEAHLDQWVEAFVEQVEAFAERRFYRALARALRAFVEAERRRLGLADHDS